MRRICAHRLRHRADAHGGPAQRHRDGLRAFVRGVVQTGEVKRLLFLYRVAPKPEQRHCVYLWEERDHLTLVVINAVNDPISGPKSEW